MYIYFGLVVLMSFFTYIFYSIDKYKSKNKKWRIKESTLLCLSFLLGAFGGIIAMYQFHHKTKHIKFIIINGISFALHITIGLYFIYI